MNIPAPLLKRICTLKIIIHIYSSYLVIWGKKWRWQVFPKSKYLLLKKIRLCLKCQPFALSVRFILFGFRYLTRLFCTSDWKFYVILKIYIFPSIYRCGFYFEGKPETQQELHLLLSVLWWHRSERPVSTAMSCIYSNKYHSDWYSCYFVYFETAKRYLFWNWQTRTHLKHCRWQKAKLPEAVFSCLFICSLISFFLCISGILFSTFQSLINFLQSSFCNYKLAAQNGDIDHSFHLSFKQSLPPHSSGMLNLGKRNCVLAVWLVLISVP